MLRAVGKVRFDTSKVIGGGHFSTVYRGFYKEETYDTEAKKVAVKRLKKDHRVEDSFIQREIEHLLPVKYHPNILPYIDYEIDTKYVYLLTELCAGTLESLVEGEYQGPKIGSDKEILYQITAGLAYLHRLEIIHRNLKPANILISFMSEDAKTKPQMKLADFGLCKALIDDKATNILEDAMKNQMKNGTVSQSGAKRGWIAQKSVTEDFISTSVLAALPGSSGWMAPELYKVNNEERAKYDSKVDIFSLGCVYTYLLTGGKHPFGNNLNEQSERIKNKGEISLVLADLKTPNHKYWTTIKLIHNTLDMKPSKRPSAEELLNDALFFGIHPSDPKFHKGLTSELLELCSSSEWTTNEFVRFTELVNDNRVNVNGKDAYGWTPLLRLIFHNHEHKKLIDMVRLLIGRGADAGIKVPDDRNILHHLCIFYDQENLIDLIELLINKKGMDVNALIPNTRGGTILHLLCEFYPHDNLIDLVRILLEKGIDVKRDDKYLLYFLLCKNYKHDNLIPLLELLMAEIGANFQEKTSFIHDLCQNYIRNDLIKLVQLFVENGGPAIRIKSKTLLYLCEHYQHKNLHELIRFFTENCFINNINKTREPSGENSVHLLYRYYKHDNVGDLIKFLIEKGVDVNARTFEGLNALHYLCSYYNHDKITGLIRLLVEKKINVNARTCARGLTPLHYLCENYEKKNLVDLVRLLIDSGADINVRDNDRYTPLHYLCANYKRGNLLKLIRLLKENGADLKAKTKKGRRATYLLFAKNPNKNHFKKMAGMVLLLTK